ncbi:MAG: hypothetical protein WCA32_09330 [Chromatiaceae bacterium]
MRTNKYLSALGCLGVIVTTQVIADTTCQDATKTTRETYPTAELTDYVVGCMVANGENPETLQKCSCSIDYIAAAIPFEEYERVQTLLRLQQVPGGGRVAIYKNSTWAKKAIAHFRDVQAESTLRCF